MPTAGVFTVSLEEKYYNKRTLFMSASDPKGRKPKQHKMVLESRMLLC
jgi:hypothetical protein